MANKKKNIGSAVVAGAAGVAVGAAVGAAAVALADEKNRKKVLKTASNVRAKAGKTVTKTMDGMKKTSKNLMTKAKSMSGNGNGRTTTKKTATRKSASKTNTVSAAQ
jgi:hypothetical protein